MLNVVLLVFVVFITACSSVVSNKDKVLVARHDLVPVSWAENESSEQARLVVVNPYEKLCCGATQSYTVSLKNLFKEKVLENSSLKPIDDFFCASLAPGRYAINLQSGAATHTLYLEAKPGRTYYVAADVHLGKSTEVLLYHMKRVTAMNYVQRAAHRIAPAGAGEDRQGKLRDQLECNSPG